MGKGETGANSGQEKRSKFIVFSQMGFTMAAVIGGFAWLGVYLDGQGKPGQKIFTIILSLLGVFLSLYYVIRSVIKMSKEKE